MILPPFSSRKNGFQGLTCSALALALLACGGGKGDSPEIVEVSAANAPNSLPSPEQSEMLLKKGARLNAAELARGAETTNSAGVASSFGQSSANAGTKAAGIANLVTVYRFFNSQTSAHFYTASESEKNTILSTLPQFSLDGAAFAASSVNAAGLSPVHRFYNTQTGVHFYTISEDEKALIQANLPQLQYDGVAYYASKVAGAGFTPLYRFFYATKGFHFFSNSEAERTNIVATMQQYQLEGVGYFVMAASSVPSTLKLPHSGITDLQCFPAGSSVFVACSSAEAIDLNPQQDGHRTAVNPLSYSEVPKASGGTYTRTECVKDNVTGLTWEGKAASGLRAGSNPYRNFDDPSQRQTWDSNTPTLTAINADNNSVGYKNYVNSISLCGYTDWRIPTANELQGIVNYSVGIDVAMIDADWFPNTSDVTYLSSSPYAGDPQLAWAVDFGEGVLIQRVRNDINYAIRLVRGNQ